MQNMNMWYCIYYVMHLMFCELNSIILLYWVTLDTTMNQWAPVVNLQLYPDSKMSKMYLNSYLNPVPAMVYISSSSACQGLRDELMSEPAKKHLFMSHHSIFSNVKIKQKQKELSHKHLHSHTHKITEAVL